MTTITQVQYEELHSYITDNDRVAFYVNLYKYTGSESALLMSQISSSSNVVGGIAWSVNNQVKKLQPALYTVGVETFSNQIAANDFLSFKKNSDGMFTVPSDLDMLKNARGVWNSKGLGEWFPGNGIIGWQELKNGNISEGLKYIGEWKAFAPVVGHAAIEFIGELGNSPRRAHSLAVRRMLTPQT